MEIGLRRTVQHTNHLISGWILSLLGITVWVALHNTLEVGFFEKTEAHNYRNVRANKILQNL